MKQISYTLSDLISDGREALGRREGRSPHAIGALLTLLWHEEASVRRAAACALAEDDITGRPASHLGHFPSAILRAIGARKCSGANDRHDAVCAALRSLVIESAMSLRGISNMRYSFLSSALYLTTVATCVDALEAIRRLRASVAQDALLQLMIELAALPVSVRINGKDIQLLMLRAGRSLASLPPAQTPNLWRALFSESLDEQNAAAAVIAHLTDAQAVPFLTDALERLELTDENAAPAIVACLARIGDPSALPALMRLEARAPRPLARAAGGAIAAILGAASPHSGRTLLRASLHHGNERDLVRPAAHHGGADRHGHLTPVAIALREAE